MTVTDTAPATDKQIRFLTTLLSDRDIESLTGANYERAFDLATGSGKFIGKREASSLIDALLHTPRNDRPTVSEVPEGIHALDQADGSIEVRKVQVAKNGSGRKYGKVLDADTGRWDYAGQRGLRGLSDDTLMTREQAERFGALYGMCGVCGATLTDEDSIERGIGPVCATRVR